MRLPRNAELWLLPLLRERARRRAQSRPAKRLWVAITDHFEPMGGSVSLEVGRARMATWQRHWPAIADAAPRDRNGKKPCFTFFYPQEEYQREIVESIAVFCRSGIADVEVHLHHDHDTAARFAEKVREFCARLQGDHGLLREHLGKLAFGFIHGNWALDNSRPDGRMCGVKGELKLLHELGCYADFTMPSLPSPTQSRVVNQIYWPTGDPLQPRGFDQGLSATVGGGKRESLMMIPGPLGLRFRGRWMPRLETGELAVYDQPTRYRVERWLALAPRIGDDIFLKLYGHSAREDNAGALLGRDGIPGSLAPMFRWIHEAAAENDLELNWASAYDMFGAIERLVTSPSETAEGKRP